MSASIMDKELIGTPDAPAEPDYDFNSDPMQYMAGAGPFVYDTIDTVGHNVKIIENTNFSIEGWSNRCI